MNRYLETYAPDTNEADGLTSDRQQFSPPYFYGGMSEVDGQLISSRETLGSKARRLSATTNAWSLWQKFLCVMIFMWVPFGMTSALALVFPTGAGGFLISFIGALLFCVLLINAARKMP